MIKDLSALVAPAPLEDLISALKNHRLLFVHTGDSQRFSRLLPWPALNMLFQANPFRTGQLRVLRTSSPLFTEMYRDPEDLSRIRLDSLQSLADQGLTLAINWIDELVPAISALTAMMERQLRCRSAADCYVSFSRGGAFRPHWDTHDVIVLQLHGRKRWRIFGRREEFPVTDYAFPKNVDPGPALWEKTLEPGDVLLIPRGNIHEAVVENNDASAHLSVGLEPQRFADILKWLAESQDLDETLRMDVNALTGPADQEAQEKRLKTVFHSLIDGISLENYLSWVDECRPFRPSLNLGLSLTLDDRTWMQPAYRRRIVFSGPQDGFVTFKTGPATHRVSAPAAELLRLLQDREAMTLGMAQTILHQTGSAELKSAARELATRGLIYVESGE